jgi:uncharacterized membrane protein
LISKIIGSIFQSGNRHNDGYLTAVSELCQFLLAFLGKKPIIHPMDQTKSALRWFPSSARGLLFLAVGILLLGWLFNTPAGLLGKADALGYAVCHRIDVRSFHLGQRQLPLCARCSGMYLGALVGLGYQAVVSHRRGGMPKWRIGIVLGLFVAAFGIDGVNSYLHLFPGISGIYEPQNWLRLVTGTGMGLVVAALIYPAFNQTVWQDWENSPPLSGLVAFLALLPLAAVVDLLVIWENPLILYPLALISAAGVLVILTMVYTMVWLIVMRRENRFQKLAQLALPLTAGFGTALLQIAFLDVLRFAITGTWGGFPLG